MDTENMLNSEVIKDNERRFALEEASIAAGFKFNKEQAERDRKRSQFEDKVKERLQEAKDDVALKEEIMSEAECERMIFDMLDQTAEAEHRDHMADLARKIEEIGKPKSEVKIEESKTETVIIQSGPANQTDKKEDDIPDAVSTAAKEAEEKHAQAVKLWEQERAALEAKIQELENSLKAEKEKVEQARTTHVALQQRIKELENEARAEAEARKLAEELRKAEEGRRGEISAILSKTQESEEKTAATVMEIAQKAEQERAAYEQRLKEAEGEVRAVREAAAKKLEAEIAVIRQKVEELKQRAAANEKALAQARAACARPAKPKTTKAPSKTPNSAKPRPKKPNHASPTKPNPAKRKKPTRPAPKK